MCSIQEGKSTYVRCEIEIVIIGKLQQTSAVAGRGPCVTPEYPQAAGCLSETTRHADMEIEADILRIYALICAGMTAHQLLDHLTTRVSGRRRSIGSRSTRVSLLITAKYVPFRAGCITAHSLLGDGRMSDPVNDRDAKASHEFDLARLLATPLTATMRCATREFPMSAAIHA